MPSLVLPYVPLFPRVACDICIMLSSSRRPLLWVSSAVLQQSSPLLLMPLGLCWPSPGQNPLSQNVLFINSDYYYDDDDDVDADVDVYESTINPSPPTTNMHFNLSKIVHFTCSWGATSAMMAPSFRLCCADAAWTTTWSIHISKGFQYDSPPEKQVYFCMHHGKLAWNLKLPPWKRRNIYKSSIFLGSMLVSRAVRPPLLHPHNFPDISNHLSFLQLSGSSTAISAVAIAQIFLRGAWHQNKGTQK